MPVVDGNFILGFVKKSGSTQKWAKYNSSSLKAKKDLCTLDRTLLPIFSSSVRLLPATMKATEPVLGHQ